MTNATNPFDALMDITARPQAVFVRGEGSWLWDDTGKRYLDFIQGWAVNCLGHAPPAVAEALAAQAKLLLSPSPAFYNALMARQQKISAQRLKRKVGTRQQIIIDEVGPTVSKGRSKADAPQIDGAVYVSSRRPLKVGEIVTAKIERADEYDLHGSVAGF